MRAQLAQTRYNSATSRATRPFIPAYLTEATEAEKQRGCCIAIPYGNAAIELRSRDAFVVETERDNKSRAPDRADNVSRKA